MTEQENQFYGMRRMAEDEIWALLAAAPVGRIATHDHERGETALTPLLFACAGGRAYFATQPGRKLALLRRYPGGIGLQCDVEQGGAWRTVYAWGSYRDVAGRELRMAFVLLARKYRERFLGQIAGQAVQALSGGPLGVWRALRGFTVGCIDLERAGGRVWGDDEDS